MTERRWAWVEVDLGAIAHNVRVLKKFAGKGTLFMAVVKADGYGHGAFQVARAALTAGAEHLGVATVDEGIELREAGINAPIQVLSEPPSSSAELCVSHHLVPMVFSRDFVIALSTAAREADTMTGYHLKVDSGMNRIGVRAEDAADFLDSLRGLPGIALEGVATHFATADAPGDWEFTRQVERFDAAVADMRQRGTDVGIVHAANSAATILHPESRYDMVRCGIALYGLHPAPSTIGVADLAPAMAVKAKITQVKRIGMGEGVSYGFTYHAPAPTTVATLPLGYADGVHRLLSNEMRVLIDGRECRQIGRICMDQLMVEVPRGAHASPGDEAVLVGEQAGAALGMDEQAELASTINYEIACGYGARMERVYRAGRT